MQRLGETQLKYITLYSQIKMKRRTPIGQKVMVNNFFDQEGDNTQESWKQILVNRYLRI